MSAGFLNGWRRTVWWRGAAPAAAIAAVLALGGCGKSAPTRNAATDRGAKLPGVCARSALDAMAHSLAVRASTIAVAAASGSNAMPQCAFTTVLPRKEHVAVTVNVDTGPQPYFVLERTIVEASQIFGPIRFSPAPVAITGLGIEAAWFPAETHLEATDGTRLVTATVDWPGAGRRRETALARALTRPYLKTPHGKAAQALAHGYPSS
jgi:hypothetical protein